ncbi:MAG: diguanylate cyclase [Aquabacterium sp.]
MSNNHNELLASHRVLSMLESACEYSEQILDNIPSVFVVLNGHNRIIRANKTFCDLVGCSMEEAIHMDFTAFFSTENKGILLHHIEHLRQQQSPTKQNQFKLQFGGHDPLQAARPFIWRVFPLEHISEAEGRVISIIGDDLSSLYQSELKLMSIFSSIPLGLMVMDRHGVITEVLSEYCHVLLNQRDLVGQALQDVLARHNSEQLETIQTVFNLLQECGNQYLPNFNAQEGVLSQLSQLRIQTEAAEKWIKPRFQPIARNEKVDRYMVTLEDITASYLAQQHIAQADMLGKQAQALYECAIRDPLSGLYTRLFMRDSISRLLASAKRGSFHELAIVMFDLDNFKRINDTYGHDAGDKVIQTFGQVVKRCIRDTDVAVRYGGEEFVLALPCNDSKETGGRIVAERIRQRLEQTPVDIGDQVLHVTTSCGVAYHHQDDTLESLLQRADKYLYLAKQHGKNQVQAESSEGA